MFSAHQFVSRKAALLFCIPVTLLFVLFIPSCSKKNTSYKSVDPAYAKYVEAYSTGIVSKTAAIRVQLATNAGTTQLPASRTASLLPLAASRRMQVTI